MEQLFNIGKGGSSSGAGMPEPGRLPGLGGAGPADFSKLLGKDLAGQDMKQLAQQADALWKFLDEMAENDEEGYKKFIEQQAEAAAEASKLAGQAGGEGGMQGLVADTAPAMLVEAPVSGGSLPPGSIAVIQIWRASKGASVAAATVGGASTSTPVTVETTSWEGLRIPLRECRPPQQQQLPQPKVTVAAAPSAPTTVVSYYLAVNEQTAALAMANKPAQLRLTLAAAACQFVETKHKGIALRRGSWRIRVNVALLAEPERSTLEAARHAAAASAAVQGTTAEGLPQSLLQQLSSPGTASLVGQAGLEAQRTAAAPGLVTRSASQPAAAAGKGPMIVELQPDIKPSEEFASQGAAGLDDAAHGCLTASLVEASEGQARHVLLQAHLPAASKASDIDMEVVKDGGGGRVVLRVAGDQLSAWLPSSVDDELAKAKFDSKKKVLTVRFPCA